MKDIWDPRCYKSKIRSPVIKNFFFFLHDFSQTSKMEKKKKKKKRLMET